MLKIESLILWNFKRTKQMNIDARKFYLIRDKSEYPLGKREPTICMNIDGI